MTPRLALEPAATLSRQFIAGWALLAAAVMFVLGVFHNDFPCEYHPDEPSKVAQLVNGTRNYYHPPLMLTLANGVVRLFGVAREAASVARVGRTLSAAYLAGAVALLTVLAGMYGGTRGSVVTAACALSINSQAVLAAHFFKEDALFMLALALTFVAGAVHWRRGGLLDLLALGAAAGLALSSKYVGVVAVVYALAVAVLTANAKYKMQNAKLRKAESARQGAEIPIDRSPSRPSSSALPFAFCILHFAFALTVLLALCNGSALWGHLAEIRAGLRAGVSTVEAGNSGVGAQVPHWQFVGMFFLSPLPALVGGVVFWADLRKRPFFAHADRWLAGLAPVWLTVMFSFSASTAVRYFLPVSLMLGCIAGIGLPVAVRWMATRLGPKTAFLGRPVGAITAAAGLVLIFGLAETVPLLHGFASDERADLTRWMATHLPAGSMIVQDSRAQLPVPTDSGTLNETGLVFRDASAVADLGTLAELRAAGVRYVVVCWYDSRRYVDPHKRPGPDARDFLRRREFYQSLPRQARSLWKGELRQPFPLQPGLELFALDP